MSIIFSRVDGRMIHGQVAIAWTRLLSVDEIVVINDAVAGDDTQTMLLELATPSGVDLKICTVEEAVELIEEDELEGSNTMIIYKNIKDAVKITEAGIEIGSLNIGGVYFAEGKTKYSKALCLDSEDIEDLKYLKTKGVDMFYQVAPMNEKESLAKYVSL